MDNLSLNLKDKSGIWSDSECEVEERYSSKDILNTPKSSITFENTLKNNKGNVTTARFLVPKRYHSLNSSFLLNKPDESVASSRSEENDDQIEPSIEIQRSHNKSSAFSK